MAEKELMRAYSGILYKTSAGSIGVSAHEARPCSRHGHNARFSRHLASAGNYKNNGLNCAIQRERFLDGAKDWMDKIN